MKQVVDGSCITSCIQLIMTCKCHQEMLVLSIRGSAITDHFKYFVDDVLYCLLSIQEKKCITYYCNFLIQLKTMTTNVYGKYLVQNIKSN